MESVFTYILKVNALIVLFYLVYQLALSRETFYKHSRWFLLSGLLVSVLLPFITFTKIEYYEVKRVLNNSIENNLPQMVQISQEAVQEPLFTNQEILFLVYGIICFGFLIKTLFDFFKLFKIIKVSNSEKRDNLVYINTNLVHTPFSFFNYIVFNEELINPVELQNIMKHEEAHSMQKHSFDTLLAQFFIILFWFNPIVWLYRKSIVQNLEFLADSYAIQQVSDKKHYQKTMLKITLQPQHISIINTFNQSSIKKRIIMLNTNKSNRKNIWKYILVVPLLTAFMLLFQIETIAQEKKSKEKIKKTTERFIYIFEKNYDDNTIKNNIKEIEKNHQLSIVVTDVKRNSENEITSINVSVDNGKGQKVNHVVHGNSPIDNFAIRITSDNGNEILEIVGKEELLYPIGTKRMKGKADSIDVIVEEMESISEIEDMEVPEMPQAPVLDINFPEAPEAPSNPNDKKAWAKFEKDMSVFEKNMKLKEGDWKKFEMEMKVFEDKMKSFEPNMKKFEQEMKVFEEKMERQGKKIEMRIEKQIKKEMKNSDLDDSKGPKGPKGPKKIKVIERIEKQ